MDKRGIRTYLIVTFAASYAIEFVVLRNRTLYPFMFFLLFVPAVAAYVAGRVSPDAAVAPSRVRGIPKITAIRMALAAPLVFAFIYLVTSLAGLTRPDWRLGELMARLPHNLNLPPAFTPFMPMVVLAMGLILTIVLGPTVYALAMLATEYGWRGYLLPRFMSLGKWRADGICGLLWGLSLAPLSAGYLSHTPSVGFSRTLITAVVLSVLLGQVWRPSRHVGLTAVCLGCFVSQATGIWVGLFPEVNIVAPWGGPFGLVSLAVWLVVGIFPEFLYGPLAPKEPGEVTAPGASRE